jgi:hypothetical protein
VGRAYEKRKWGKNVIRNGKEQLEDVNVDGEIILKLILKRMWSEVLDWLL